MVFVPPLATRFDDFTSRITAAMNSLDKDTLRQGCQTRRLRAAFGPRRSLSMRPGARSISKKKVLSSSGIQSSVSDQQYLKKDDCVEMLERL